jgi:hypothetical protein
MLGEVIDATVAAERARVVLLHHLWVALNGRWPGTDGLTEGDVLRSYPALAAAGRVPGRGEPLRRHPELAAALTRLLDRADPTEALR